MNIIPTAHCLNCEEVFYETPLNPQRECYNCMTGNYLTDTLSMEELGRAAYYNYRGYADA